MFLDPVQDPKGWTIIFSPGGIMISRRQKIFFYRRLSACKFFSSTHCADIFFKFPKFPITGVAFADNFFSDAPLGQRIYFSNFSHADNLFSQLRYPPSPGKIMVHP